MTLDGSSNTHDYICVWCEKPIEGERVSVAGRSEWQHWECLMDSGLAEMGLEPEGGWPVR